MTTSQSPNHKYHLDLAAKFGQLLPTFDGDCKKLNSFIKSCTSYLIQFENSEPVVKTYCLAVIQNKLIGKAADEFYSSNIPDTWIDLNQFLNTKFGDRVNLDVLKNELQFLRKSPNEHIFQFIDRIKSYKIRIYFRIDADLTLDINLKLLHKQLVEALAKNVLMGNVPIDLQTAMLTTPNLTFDLAVQMIENYIIQKEQLDMIRSQQRNQMKTQNFTSSFQNANSFSNNMPTQGSNFPSQPIQLHFRQNIPKPKFPTNKQVFGKPPDVFKPRQDKPSYYQSTPMSTRTQAFQSYGPTPMSTKTHRNYPEKRPYTSSTQTNQQHTRFKNSHNFFQPTNQGQNFISEELTNLQDECQIDPESNQLTLLEENSNELDYEYNNEDFHEEPSDFREEASEEQ